MSDFADSLGDELMASGDEPQTEIPATQPEQQPIQPEPQPEPQALEPEQPPQGGHIPIQALLDEREKRQEAKREADALRAQIAQLQQAPSQPVVDLYDDPDAWAATQQATIAEQMWQVRRDMSANFAIEKFGKDTVDAAIVWASERNDPYLHQRFKASNDPYREVLVPEFNRDQLLSKIGSDPDAYVRQRYAELTSGSQTTQPVAQAATPSIAASRPAPRSLAGQPSAGSGPAIAEAAFDEVRFGLDKR